MGSPTLASAAPLTQPLSDITLTATRQSRVVLIPAAVLLSISPFAQSSAGVPLTSGTNSAGRIHYTHRPPASPEAGVGNRHCPGRSSGVVVCLEEYRESTAPTIDNLRKLTRKLTEFRLILLAMVEGSYGHDQH